MRHIDFGVHWMSGHQMQMFYAPFVYLLFAFERRNVQAPYSHRPATSISPYQMPYGCVPISQTGFE